MSSNSNRPVSGFHRRRTTSELGRAPSGTRAISSPLLGRSASGRRRPAGRPRRGRCPASGSRPPMQVRGPGSPGSEGWSIVPGPSSPGRSRGRSRRCGRPPRCGRSGRRSHPWRCAGRRRTARSPCATAGRRPSPGRAGRQRGVDREARPAVDASLRCRRGRWRRSRSECVAVLRVLAACGPGRSPRTSPLVEGALEGGALLGEELEPRRAADVEPSAGARPRGRAAPSCRP